MWITIEGLIEIQDISLQVGTSLYSEKEELLLWSFHNDTNEYKWPKLQKGLNTLIVKFPKQLFNECSYRVELLVSLYHREWIFKPGGNNPFINIDVQGGLSNSPYWYQKRPGIFAPVLKWESIKHF